MRIIANGRIRRVDEGVSYGTGTTVKQLSTWDLATNDDGATVEAAGYFNTMAGELRVGDVIVARLDLDAAPVLKNYLVTANTGTAVTVAKQTTV